MITCSVLNSVKIAERNQKFQLKNMSHGNANINPLLDALTKNLDTLLLMLQGIYNLFYNNFFTHFISQRVHVFSIPSYWKYIPVHSKYCTINDSVKILISV